MKRLRLSLLMMSFLFASGCGSSSDDHMPADFDYTPAAFRVDGERAIMSGDIDSTTPERVRMLIDEYPEVKTIVMVEVEGSVDDIANLEASRRVRRHGFNTHVPADGVIASGGVDFFLAGVERTVEPGAMLGVHSWATDDGVRGDQVPRDDPEHARYLNYYKEMRISAEFYWFTLQAAPPESVHYMTPAEITRYQITTR